MKRTSVVLMNAIVFVFGAQQVDAGAVVELVPQKPGPYETNIMVSVDVVLHNQESFDVEIRLAQLDFSDTDPALGLAPQFAFDLSTLVDTTDYALFPNLPVPAAAYTEVEPIAGHMLTLAAGGSLRLGSIAVSTPSGVGNFTLDVMNSDEPDANFGAQIHFGFGVNPDDPITLWSGYSGDLTGGVMSIVVADNCVAVENPLQSDVDGDGFGDVCDDCPADATNGCDPSGSAAGEVTASAGGTISTADGAVLAIPPGGLSSDRTISITRVEPGSSEVDIIFGGGPARGQAVAMYDLRPDGLELNGKLTITQDVSGVPPGQRNNLTIYTESAGRFVPIEDKDCSVVADTATCTAQITHFSRFALIFPVAAAAIPATSHWGLVVLALSLLTLKRVGSRRRT